MRLFHLFLLAFLECVWSHEFFPSLTRTHKFLKHRSLEISKATHFEVIGIKSHLPLTLHSGGGDEFTLPVLDKHPISTSVKFSAFGHHFDFELVKSKLFAPTYREHTQTYRNGTLIRDRATVLPPSRDCHYQSESPQNGSVRAGLSTCRGAFEGLVVGQDDIFGIQPAGFHLTKEDIQEAMRKHAGVAISELHVIYKLTDYSVNGSCPLTEDHDHNIIIDENKTKPKFSLSSFLPSSFRTKETLQSNQIYVELLLVNDHLRKTQTNGYTEDNAATVANGANVLYQSVTLTPLVQLVLVAQVTFDDSDPYSVTLGACSCSSTEVSVNELLGDFQAWRSGPNAPAHDCGHLLSGYNFESSVIGFANVNGMCLVSYSGGIVQSFGFPTNLVSATLSHEMGHNFGMQHDGNGNTCPNSGFIMNSVLAVIPTEFSSCSVDYYEQFVNGYTCLLNVPTYKWGDPVCGNNFVETGEECDCGPPPCLNDPCCDGATCLRKAGAVCTAGQECCDDNCHPRNDTSYQCRPASSGCDIPEYCDGVSADCPLDWYLGAGTLCNTSLGDTGGCYLGACLSYYAQCKGDTSSSGGWDPCSVSDQTSNNGDNFCSNLWCLNPDPNVGCVFIENADGSTDRMLDGIPCGTGFQCFGGACVASDKLQQQFFWKPNAWQDCDSCDEEQTRNVSCWFQDVTLASPPPPYMIAANYCAPFSFPSLTQTCDNVTLGCIGSDLFAGSTINFFGVFEIQKLALVLVVFGIVAGTIIIIAGCYKAVTYESGPPPNPRVRQIGKKGQPQRGARVRPQQQQQQQQRQGQPSRARPPSRQGP